MRPQSRFSRSMVRGNGWIIRTWVVLYAYLFGCPCSRSRAGRDSTGIRHSRNLVGRSVVSFNMSTWWRFSNDWQSQIDQLSVQFRADCRYRPCDVPPWPTMTSFKKAICLANDGGEGVQRPRLPAAAFRAPSRSHPSQPHRHCPSSGSS